jgi:hypothetical protein
VNGTVKLSFIRELRLAGEIDGASYFHAASGLVLCGGIAHVVSDDSTALASFALAGETAGRVMRLLARSALPSDTAARKRLKPDFEVLVSLPPEHCLPYGGLLAMGSGSTPARSAGAIVALDSDGWAISATEVDLESSLYSKLRSVFSEVNIEGGVWRDSRLLLFQRGNASEPTSAAVTFEIPSPAAALQCKNAIGLPHVHRLHLGSIDGVPLTLTDATLLDDRILYLATAERTPNAYDDGDVLGSVLGVLSGDCELTEQWCLDPPLKFEGIAACRKGKHFEFLVVSDADDAAVPSKLFKGRVPSV